MERLSQFGNMHSEGRIQHTTASVEFDFLISRESTMANQKADDREPAFSFGTRELREARRAAQPLALAEPETPRKGAPGAAAGAGFDPYNTSGSFDRRKHWERVGKR
jgi:hypothetical protein